MVGDDYLGSESKPRNIILASDTKAQGNRECLTFRVKNRAACAKVYLRLVLLTAFAVTPRSIEFRTS